MRERSKLIKTILLLFLTIIILIINAGEKDWPLLLQYRENAYTPFALARQMKQRAEVAAIKADERKKKK